MLDANLAIFLKIVKNWPLEKAKVSLELVFCRFGPLMACAVVT